MHLAQVLAVLFAFTLAGVVLRRAGILDVSAAGLLNRIALTVTLPAAIFRSLHAFPIARGDLGPPLMTAALTVVVCLAASAVARRLHLPRPEAAVFVMSIAFSNTAFVGYPVVRAAYGETGLAEAVLIDQLAMEPLAFTLALAIAAAAGEGGQVPWAEEIWKLLRFPPMVALAAAIVWKLAGGPPMPELVSSELKALGELTVPLVMVAMGLVLRLGTLRRTWREAIVIAALRLAVIPAAALGLARVLRFSHLQASVTTLELGMPAMSFTFMLALRYGLDAEASAGFVTATLLGSMATLPMWVGLLGQGVTGP